MAEDLTVTELSSTSQFEPSYDTAVDLVIAILLIICFLCGSVFNSITIVYFGKMVKRDLVAKKDNRTNKKLLYNGLYFMNSINDFLICFTILPVSISFVKDRKEVWFGNGAFCALWGVFWEILPYLSIMYVMVMSLTRTFHLLFPLKNIRLTVVAVLVLIYTLFCAGRSLVPVFSDLGVYTYHEDSVYCFEWVILQNRVYLQFAEYSDLIQLAVPILPILTACSISTLLIYCCRTSASNSVSKTSQLQRHASNTIIFFTLLYIVLNIPVIALCVLYTIVYVNKKSYNQVFNTQFLYWYSWSCVYILGVTLNANLNPVLYFWRMKHFRTFVRTLGRGTPINIKSTMYANQAVSAPASAKCSGRVKVQETGRKVEKMHMCFSTTTTSTEL